MIRMYEPAYNKLFWGMMFIVFNINLGPINIMPNFIGYMLILSGLNILANQQSQFEKGKTPAFILILLSIMDIVNIEGADILNVGLSINNLAAIFITAIGVVENLICIYLIYILCKGIYLLSEERGIVELKESARVRFNYYLITAVILLFFTPFTLNLSRDIRIYILIAVTLNSIGQLFIAGLFRKSKYQLGECLNR